MQGDPGAWLNPDKLRVILTRMNADGTGETIVNVQGKQDVHPITWKKHDAVVVLTYPHRKVSVVIRILTPEIVANYDWSLETEHLAEGMGPAFFAAMDAVEGRQVYRIVERDGGWFDSLVGGDRVGNSGNPAKCANCPAFALCPFRLQGCYLACDPTVALKACETLNVIHESYRQQREVRPASLSVPQPGERPGLYSYSRRGPLVR